MYCNAFVQEPKHCNASVQESLLKVGAIQVGEGGSTDLEETLHLMRSLSTNLRLKLKLISGEETKITPLPCQLARVMLENFTHLSIK